MYRYNQYYCQHCRSAYNRSQEKSTPGYCSLHCSTSESARLLQKTFKELTLEGRSGVAYVEHDSGIPPESAVKTIPVRKREYKCICCGIADYNNRPLKLQLFHLDSNQNNFARDNVEFLCPNCLSQYQ